MSDPASAAWPAIGTTAVLRVSDARNLATGEALLRDELARIDRAASSFRPDSELNRVNARAGGVIEVGGALHEAIAAAIGAAAASDGLVDPTLGAEPGWREIDLLDWAVRIPAGATLDLGATAKALSADRAARRIAAATDGAGVLVALGGDIAVAGRPPAGGWPVHVTDDHRSATSGPGQRVTIDGGALASSGTTVRRWVNAEGAWCHHIIDPRTRRCAAGPWRTVSVTAASCVDANTASTAAIILGAGAPDWLAARGLAARLVAVDGAVHTLGGWPADSGTPPVPGVSAEPERADPPTPDLAGARR